MLGTPPVERADAARNRRRILAAAAELFAEHGVDAVSMDAIAAAAGVGKGTLFRRFDDKSGLAAALIDERERRLQEQILHGPGPIGPPGLPRQRLAAFVTAYLAHLEETLDIVRLSETAAPSVRFRIGSYRFWHRHLVVLFTTTGSTVPPEYAADAVLAALAADLVTNQRRRGMSWEDITAGAVTLSRSLARRGTRRAPSAGRPG